MKIKQTHIDEIILDDFHQHPIWGWVDEDGDSPNLMPISSSYLDDKANKTNDGYTNDILFIHSTFTLNDGSQYKGYIGVVLSQKRPFVLALDVDGHLINYSLISIVQKVYPKEKFFESIGKNKDDISHILFETSYTYFDGSSVSGKIDLD